MWACHGDSAPRVERGELGLIPALGHFSPEASRGFEDGLIISGSSLPAPCSFLSSFMAPALEVDPAELLEQPRQREVSLPDALHAGVGELEDLAVGALALAEVQAPHKELDRGEGVRAVVGVVPRTEAIQFARGLARTTREEVGFGVEEVGAQERERGAPLLGRQADTCSGFAEARVVTALERVEGQTEEGKVTLGRTAGLGERFVGELGVTTTRIEHGDEIVGRGLGWSPGPLNAGEGGCIVTVLGVEVGTDLHLVVDAKGKLESEALEPGEWTRSRFRAHSKLAQHNVAAMIVVD